MNNELKSEEIKYVNNLLLIYDKRISNITIGMFSTLYLILFTDSLLIRSFIFIIPVLFLIINKKLKEIHNQKINELNSYKKRLT